jgi:hypothetical protein
VETCDATSSGSETATIVVHTPSGPLYLCTHHFKVNEAMFEAAGYRVSLVGDEELSAVLA